MKKIIVFALLAVASGWASQSFFNDDGFLQWYSPAIAYGCAMAIFFLIYNQKTPALFLKLLGTIAGSCGVWFLVLRLAGDDVPRLLTAGGVGALLLGCLVRILFSRFPILFVVLTGIGGSLLGLTFYVYVYSYNLLFVLWQVGVSIIIATGFWYLERKNDHILTQSPSSH